MQYLILVCTLFFGFKSMPNNTSIEKTNSIKALDFEIYSQSTKAVILYEKNENPLDSIVSYQLAEDIFKVTNYKPEVVTSIKKAYGNVIVIGTINSKLIGDFLNKKKIKTGFENQWESYHYKTISNPTKKIKKAFIIAGTNPRGTAYGVFNISKKIGVSPWYWWADVPIKQSNELILNQPDYYSNPPSVAYRGIFLNDEDWSLQPWAAKTFEPETGDIGPKTYSKIFELLLRLNANTIWPAMHPSTKAFFYYPNNAKMASLYNIVIGTSHAEPMLRNNVDEWDENKFGSFNYKTNKDHVYKYWETRVKESKNIDAIYTMGMRGVHDSGMEGVKSKDEAVLLLDGIISDQRGLLKKHINPNIEKIPQAFTVYKEVLDLYKNGLQVPDDITLVWTDDNYGYIRALSNAEEQKRSGSGGVYYHASYWGRPHDYLWLSTTHPALIREEMMKAYNLNNNEIWILNVGDIKPIEYNTQLFLDMAYDAEKFQNPEYTIQHQQQFYGDIFGSEFAENITEIKQSYFDLAFERKPEFMGWSQTEPTTPISTTAYNPFVNGDEIQKRIGAYKTIEKQVEAIETQLPENLKSSFTQLISYPVKASANMNKKFLYRDKALSYAKQGRLSASKYKTLSNEAFENIEALTKNYNELSNGKWQGFMDMKPRNLPVFDNPSIELEFAEVNYLGASPQGIYRKNIKNSRQASEHSNLDYRANDAFGFALEDTLSTIEGTKRLPTFYVDDSSSYFIDIFLKKATRVTWQIKELPNWIHVTKLSGILNNSDMLEDRIFVSIDWDAWKQAGEPISKIIKIQLNSEEKHIQINISQSYSNIPENSFVEKNGKVVLYANHYSNNEAKNNFLWKEIIGLGHSKSVMESLPLNGSPLLNHENAPVLNYELFTETATQNATLNVTAIPTHPITTDSELRIAVQWNNEPIQMVNFKTEGRSSTWKNSVLSNKTVGKIQVPITEKGKQTLKIYMIDPGVLLDYIVLNTKDKNILPYQLIPETKINSLNN